MGGPQKGLDDRVLVHHSARDVVRLGVLQEDGEDLAGHGAAHPCGARGP